MTIAASPGSRKGSSGMGQAWSRFRTWRQTRPFWGSVISIIGGVEIYLAAAAPLSVVVMQGLPGLLTMAVFLVTVILAGVTLFQPHLRTITGPLILIIGPLSIMATNLGGFVIGMILLVVGGGLIFAWGPAEDPLDLEYIAGEPASEPSPAVRPARPAAITKVLAAAPGPRSPDPDSPDHFASTPVRLGDPDAELAAQKAALKAALKTSPARPGQKKKRPAPRTGLPGVFDTMFGTRRQPARKPGQRPAGKRPAGKRPAGGRPAGQRPAGDPGSSGSSEPAGPAASLSSLAPPADPPAANARTLIIIPMLLVALGTPAVLAGPASASPVRPVSDSPFDWLFPAATPTPSPSATPAPSATPGFVLPTLPNLLPTPSPTPTPSGGTADAAVDAAGAVDCAAADQLKGTTSGGQAAIDGAVAMSACAKAAAADPVSAKAVTATDLVASNELIDLRASRMEMEGFGYAGLATVKSAKGPIQTLHFTADSVTIYDMNQTYPFVGGSNVLKNAKGTAVLKGNVNLYVTSFDSKVFGLVPLTFTPDFQPPLVLPSMFFTDAKSSVVLVQSDQILLPDLTIAVS